MLQGKPRRVKLDLWRKRPIFLFFRIGHHPKIYVRLYRDNTCILLPNANRQQDYYEKKRNSKVVM